MGDRTPIDLMRDYERGGLLRHGDVNALMAFARRQVIGDNFAGDDDVAMHYTRQKSRGGRLNRGEWFKNTTSDAAPPGAVLVPTAPFAVADDVGWEAGRRTEGGLEPCLVADLVSSVVEDGQDNCRWAWKGAWCLYDHGDDVDDPTIPTLGQLWGLEVGSWSLSRGGSMDFVALGNAFRVLDAWYGNFVQPLSAKVFAVTNGSLSQGATCEVETLRSTGGSPAWERTGYALTARDVFLNTDATVDAGTVVGVKRYDGLSVIDSMYCDANDWLAD